MVNAFVEFVKEYRKKNPKLSYKDAMKEAAKVYKKGEKTEKSQKKSKSAKPNLKMTIKEPKNVRAKNLRKYKKLKKEVEDNLGKKRMRPKEYNEYLVLAEKLAGASAKNSYARHLKMVRRKLGTKGLKPLKERLDKAKKDSNELIDLLDKQKASNIKRPVKTQSKYIEEQNRMNRYRRILGEKISEFNKNPQNKGKTLPRAKLEREAEEEAEELVITEQIEGNLKKIDASSLPTKLVYATEYKKHKAKNPSATRTTFKPIYAQLKKAFDAQKAKDKKKSAPLTRTRSISRTVSTTEEPKVKDDKPKVKPLTQLQTKNLKNRVEDFDKATTKDPKGLFIALGKPDKALMTRYVKQLKAIEKKQPDNEDVEKILELYEELADNIDDIRRELKPPRKSPTKFKPKSKEVVSDTDDEGAAAAPPPKTGKFFLVKIKNAAGKEFKVEKKAKNIIEKKLNEEKEKGRYGDDKANLTVAYHRQYLFKGNSQTEKLPAAKVNAIIDNYELKNFGKIVSSSVGASGSETEADTSEGSSSSFDPSKVKEFTPSEKAIQLVKPLDELVNLASTQYGYSAGNSITAELELKKNSAAKEILFSREDSADVRVDAAKDLFDMFRTDGLLSDETKSIDLEQLDGSSTELTIKMKDLISLYKRDTIVDIMAQADGLDEDFEPIVGEGFAGVEPINSVDDLEDAKGGALVDLIHRKLIKNNPKAKKKKEVDKDDEKFVAFSKMAYTKPTERKANLEGFEYNRAQSDEENSVYQNDKTKEIVIAFRGTAKMKDLKADLGIATGRLSSTARYDNTEKLVKKLKDLFPEYSITLTGHSLGGSLAIAISNKHDIPSVVFNAGHSIGSSNKGDIKYYTKMGDPVSMLGANSYKDVNVIEGSHKNPLKDHMLNNFDGGSLLGDVGRTLISEGGDTDAANRLKGAASSAFQKGMGVAVDGASNMIKNQLRQGFNKALYGGDLLGTKPNTYTPKNLKGAGLVKNIKGKLMKFASLKDAKKKAKILKDTYTLVNRIKNEGFKVAMLKELANIASELNEVL